MSTFDPLDKKMTTSQLTLFSDTKPVTETDVQQWVFLNLLFDISLDIFKFARICLYLIKNGCFKNNKLSQFLSG